MQGVSVRVAWISEQIAFAPRRVASTIETACRDSSRRSFEGSCAADLAGGFARFHCGSCRLNRLVPFSCKGRAVCPSCGGRRMAERAAHLVDHVLPEVPVPRPNWLWAELMQRSFGFDVLACPHCGRRLELIAVIEDSRVIRRILNHLGLPAEVPAAGPAWSPPLPMRNPIHGTVRRRAGRALSAEVHEASDSGTGLRPRDEERCAPQRSV